MKTYFTTILLVTALFCQKKNDLSIKDKLQFSYSLLAKDSIISDYFNLSSSTLESSNEFNFGKNGSISLQKFKLDKEAKIFLYKHNFSGIDKLTDIRDAICLLYTSPSPRDGLLSRMPSSA